MTRKLNWTLEGNVGDVFSNSSPHQPTQGRIPYLIEHHHGGDVSLSMNLLIRGLATHEQARRIAQKIEDTVDGLVKSAGGVR